MIKTLDELNDAFEAIDSPLAAKIVGKDLLVYDYDCESGATEDGILVGSFPIQEHRGGVAGSAITAWQAFGNDIVALFFLAQSVAEANPGLRHLIYPAAANIEATYGEACIKKYVGIEAKDGKLVPVEDWSPPRA